MKKVVVALSGGIDSSVAALILKKKGYQVIGLFMDNWDETNLINCTWKSDSIDAMIISNQLNIPFQIIKMKKEYKKYVVNYIYREYQLGKTPNPDILCNKEIKFHLFLKLSIDLGADFIATGHYVYKKSTIKNNKKIYRLFMGIDSNKDQSYFLCQLSQYQLKRSLFPLGKLTKEQVRKIAKKNGLNNYNKKDSQGICFIGKINLSHFLSQKIPLKKGEIICISAHSPIYHQKVTFSSLEEKLFFLSKKKQYKKSDGKLIGYHQGAHLFTKGQRKGISLGGYSSPQFVLDTDIKQNIIYTGLGKNHPGLYRKILFINEENIHWIRNDLILFEGEKMNVFCKIRYRQPLQKSILHKMKKGMFIEFDHLQCAISEGQFVVWYINNELIGSGVIS
ncbi:tRNA 2-thiouridine(34) synthase MnmA [Blattabacterium cuenoti]|uniref:tRNA 2-thiouridine(34) synthase MnmA n=1 Tax=Blattabacterium cuenoti TaxID=1653831 RepID=UPI00163C898F|nr:tRNA 2-thiouridine(34) synthase MnmA [Blattabacterium cuenoti]